MSSPTSPRRRASLTPYQALLHASGSFFPPVTHGQDEWTYRKPAASSQSSTPTSLEPNCISAMPPDTPAQATSPVHHRPQSSSVPGVHYSSAFRRVPSSPSFRSSLAFTSSYFDRPPSPSSSVSSRSSEPPLSANLSLSELMATSATISLSGRAQNEPGDPARREMQREERRLAMRERHAAIMERRDKERWAKLQAQC